MGLWIPSLCPSWPQVLLVPCGILCSDLLPSPPAAESRDALESPKELEKPDPGENPQEADTWNGPGECLLWGHPSPSRCPGWICWSKHQYGERWAGCKPQTCWRGGVRWWLSSLTSPGCCWDPKSPDLGAAGMPSPQLASLGLGPSCVAPGHFTNTLATTRAMLGWFGDGYQNPKEQIQPLSPPGISTPRAPGQQRGRAGPVGAPSPISHDLQSRGVTDVCHTDPQRQGMAALGALEIPRQGHLGQVTQGHI